MIKQTRPISRRTLLKGAGAALSLPWLEAMMPTSSRASGKTERPTRLAVLFMPNGVREDEWTPEGEGTEFKLSPTLEPLQDLKNDILVLTNLWNQASNYGDGHYVKTSGFLTCATINKSLGFDLNSNGISMDQMAAAHTAGKTPLPSLELAIDPVSIGVDTNVGYTRVYGSHIAWSHPTRPLARETNPRLVFERLFRAGNPNRDEAQRDKLLLDRVLKDAGQLRKRVGASDRSRLDDYLESVRSLERRVELASRNSKQDWSPQADMPPELKPAGIPSEHAEHVRLMLDMIALAFQTDTTRVCTFMMGNAVSNKNFSFLDGVEGGHHSLSHHQSKSESLRQYQLIARWHIQQYAYLLNKLKGFQEEDGNILDHSMVLFGSGLRDGIVLGGGAGGRIKGGRHMVYQKNTPLSNLYRPMLNAFGSPVEQFADSTEELPGILS